MHNHPVLKYLAFVLVVLLSACEQAERNSSEHLVFKVNAVEASASTPGFETFRSSGNFRIISPGETFLPPDSSEPSAAAPYTPTRLSITFKPQGDLVPSLLLPLGYRATTRIEFEDGSSISVNHTNVADSLYVAPGDSLGDTLYVAIRGEGLVSGGDAVFNNATGLFFEQSTYRIVNGALITNISCSYQLMIDF